MWTTFMEKLAGARRSLTVWFNSVAGTVVLGLPMLQDSLPQLQSYLPANYFKYAMGAVVAINILLRFRTKTALENK